MGSSELRPEVTGKPLFVAPIGRSMDDFLRESDAHGWPSFRDQEARALGRRQGGGGEAPGHSREFSARWIHGGCVALWIQAECTRCFPTRSSFALCRHRKKGCDAMRCDGHALPSFGRAGSCLDMIVDNRLFLFIFL